MNSRTQSIRSKMAKFKKNQAEKQGLETSLNCDVMNHAKKETYINSGVKRDFGFFFCIRNATPHRLCTPNITILEKFDPRTCSVTLRLREKNDINITTEKAIQINREYCSWLRGNEK